MPRQTKEKSTHLQELEAVFDRHTRRFSPFDVLGLRPSEAGSEAVPQEESEESNPPTPRGVGATHPADPPTPLGVGGTSLLEVDATPTPAVTRETLGSSASTGMRIHDVL